MKALLAQTRSELMLSLRNGEQLLVNVAIPLLLLVFFSAVKVLPIPARVFGRHKYLLLPFAKDALGGGKFLVSLANCKGLTTCDGNIHRLFSSSNAGPRPSSRTCSRTPSTIKNCEGAEA